VPSFDRDIKAGQPGLMVQTVDGWRFFALYSCPDFLETEAEETIESEDGDGLALEAATDALWPASHPGRIAQVIGGHMGYPYWGCADA